MYSFLGPYINSCGDKARPQGGEPRGGRALATTLHTPTREGARERSRERERERERGRERGRGAFADRTDADTIGL